jgi:hypothetical protein
LDGSVWAGRRKIENRFVSTESQFIDMAWYDECVIPSLTMAASDPRLPIAVGIDASVKHDQTAIVAVTWDYAKRRMRLVWHKIFQPRPNEPLDFEQTIERTALDLNQRFDLRCCRFDPYQMVSTAQPLKNAGIKIRCRFKAAVARGKPRIPFRPSPSVPGGSEIAPVPEPPGW